MKVREIMATTPITLDPDMPVVQVARVLLDYRLPGAAVVDKQGTVLGVVTEADLIVRNANLHFPRFIAFVDALVPAGPVHEFEEELRRMLATTAREVMSEKVVTISPDAEVADAATVMFEKHANPLPVTKDGRLVGVITRTDLVRLMLLEEDESTGRLAPRR